MVNGLCAHFKMRTDASRQCSDAGDNAVVTGNPVNLKRCTTCEGAAFFLFGEKLPP